MTVVAIVETTSILYIVAVAAGLWYCICPVDKLSTMLTCMYEYMAQRVCVVLIFSVKQIMAQDTMRELNSNKMHIHLTSLRLICFLH